MFVFTGEERIESLTDVFESERTQLCIRFYNGDVHSCGKGDETWPTGHQQ
jgi:hypothetical protein